MIANNQTNFLRCILKTSVVMSVTFVSAKAMAQGTIKLNSTLLDSEAAQGWVLSPAGEFSYATVVKSGWSAATQLRIAPLKANDPAARFDLRLKEAAVTSEFEEGRVSAGRILARLESSGLNESVKAFIRGELSFDGVRFERTENNLQWGVFAGGPQMFGFNLGADFQGTKVALIYRGERHKLGQFLAVGAEGSLSNNLRASHSHEAEFSVKVTGEEFQIESLFQLLSQGSQRKITIVDDTLGEQKIGEIDTTLPNSNNEYRVVTQFKSLFLTQNDSRDWLVFSLGARTATQYHQGSEDEKVFRQGAGGEMQLTTAYESTNDTFTTQAGLSGEYSSTPKYFMFAARNSQGERKQVKSKWTAWISSRIKF